MIVPVCCLPVCHPFVPPRCNPGYNNSYTSKPAPTNPWINGKHRMIEIHQIKTPGRVLSLSPVHLAPVPAP